MSIPAFVYTFEYGEPKVVVTLSGGSRAEARRRVKVALGWLPDDLRLTEVTEVTG